GANPPREQWKLPPTKTEEESRTAYQTFEGYVRFIARHPDVQFITATEAAKLYRDKARGRKFTPAELREIAAAVGEGVTFQQRAGGRGGGPLPEARGVRLGGQRGVRPVERVRRRAGRGPGAGRRRAEGDAAGADRPGAGAGGAGDDRREPVPAHRGGRGRLPP